MGAGKLPTSWQQAPLGEVLDLIVGGGTPPKNKPEYFQGDIPLMTVKDMRERRPSGTGFNITREALGNSSAKLIPADTIVIATRMGLGKVVRAPFETAINQDLKALFPSIGIDKSYLEFWLRSIAEKLENMGTGTTVKGLRLEKLKSLEFPVAPSNEQHRIVEKIETLFAHIDKGEEALREVQKLLKRYRQSILKAAVTGSLIGNDWRMLNEVPLGDLLLDIRYGTAKKCGRDESQTPVLRIPNVVSGGIDLSDLKYTPLSDKEHDKLSLKCGDILLVRSNDSANLVARGAIVDEKAVGFAYAGYLIRLRIDQTRITPQFLQIVLDSPQMRSVIELQARSTSGVHNINSSEIKNLSIPVPSLGEQLDVTTEVNKLFSDAESLEVRCESELQRSSALRQSILKSAFTGQLVPQDIDDEPASELLARIQPAMADKSNKGNLLKEGR